MDALVLLLATPTMGAPPRVCPLPKGLLPVLLNGLEEPVLVEPVVPELPDESEPVLLLDDDVILEEDAAPPNGFEVSPGVPPSTLLPAVVERPPF